MRRKAPGSDGEPVRSCLARVDGRRPHAGRAPGAVAVEGFEPLTAPPANPTQVPGFGIGCGDPPDRGEKASGVPLGVQRYADPDFIALAERWSSLPSELRSAILRVAGVSR